MLHRLQSSVQRGASVLGQDVHRLLREDRTVVDEFVDQMHGHPGDTDTGCERITHGIRAAERRQ